MLGYGGNKGVFGTSLLGADERFVAVAWTPMFGHYLDTAGPRRLLFVGVDDLVS